MECKLFDELPPKDLEFRKSLLSSICSNGSSFYNLIKRNYTFILYMHSTERMEILIRNSKVADIAAGAVKGAAPLSLARIVLVLVGAAQ